MERFSPMGLLRSALTVLMHSQSYLFYKLSLYALDFVVFSCVVTPFYMRNITFKILYSAYKAMLRIVFALLRWNMYVFNIFSFFLYFILSFSRASGVRTVQYKGLQSEF